MRREAGTVPTPNNYDDEAHYVTLTNAVALWSPRPYLNGTVTAGAAALSGPASKTAAAT